MGEKKKGLVLGFNRSIKFEFCGSKISSNAGLFLYRELDEKLQLTEGAAASLKEMRSGKNTQFEFVDLLRQSIYTRLAGYEDASDADLLRNDPVLRYLLGGKAESDAAASSSEIGRFETQYLTQSENLEVLKNINRQWIDKTNQHRSKKMRLKEIILDIDSSESEVYGDQEGAKYNGYFGCKCYHPLFCFNQFGDLEAAMLRNGNVHSANNWKQMVVPAVEKYKEQDLDVFLRADSAFAGPELYDFAEENEIKYVSRLKYNPNLAAAVEDLLTRPVGRPSHKPKIFYRSFSYQAASWTKPRRVVAKIEWRYGELFPKVGFLITNLAWQSKRIVKFYNKRGTAEQWIKEGKNAVKWTKLSCQKFVANDVRLHVTAQDKALVTYQLERTIDQAGCQINQTCTLCTVSSGRVYRGWRHIWQDSTQHSTDTVMSWVMLRHYSGYCVPERGSAMGRCALAPHKKQNLQLNACQKQFFIRFSCKNRKNSGIAVNVSLSLALMMRFGPYMGDVRLI
jgi:hypothetical protein